MSTSSGLLLKVCACMVANMAAAIWPSYLAKVTGCCDLGVTRSNKMLLLQLIFQPVSCTNCWFSYVDWGYGGQSHGEVRRCVCFVEQPDGSI